MLIVRRPHFRSVLIYVAPVLNKRELKVLLKNIGLTERYPATPYEQAHDSSGEEKLISNRKRS